PRVGNISTRRPPRPPSRPSRPRARSKRKKASPIGPAACGGPLAYVGGVCRVQSPHSTLLITIVHRGAGHGGQLVESPTRSNTVPAVAQTTKTVGTSIFVRRAGVYTGCASTPCSMVRGPSSGAATTICPFRFRRTPLTRRRLPGQIGRAHV